MKSKDHALPSSIVGLSPFELARKIPLAAAAEHNGVHVDTFKKAYPHLLVTVHDTIVLPPPNGPPAAR
jgi:hypothetical protein